MTSKLNLLRVSALAGMALALLASCGGGTQAEQFAPNRIVVFGDEQSLIVPTTAPEGLKHTVNGVERAADGTTLVVPTNRTCARNPIWVQVVATNYGFQFPQCATTPGLSSTGVMRAQANSTVAMMAAQIDAFSTSPGFNDKDLVTIMVGTHDVIAALGAANPVTAAEAAGTAVGQQVVNMTDRGAKVIVATIPNVGTTPLGRLSGQAQLLAQLTESFNSRLRIKLGEVRRGGHSVGLVRGDDLALQILSAPPAYGIVNVVDAACADITNCDEANVVAGAAANRGADWLWAGPLQLGPNAQNRLGGIAASRARSNPFY